MTAVALKGLAARKLRASLTAIAIVLGVAMISGTYVLTDTINAGFDTIFTQSYQNADAVITGKTAFAGTDETGDVVSPGFAESVLERVRTLPDVAAAAGGIQDEAKLIGKDGKALSTGGAPTLAFSVDAGGDERFNPLTLVDGRWPQGPNEIAVDQAVAGDEGFRLGDAVGVSTHEGLRQFRLVGIAKFGAVESIGGATLAIFDIPTAQTLFDKDGKLDIVRVAARPGVSSAELVREIAPLLPSTAVVRDPNAQVKEDKREVGSFLSFLQKALLAFAGVALFVGAFVIANTLSITIAQRTREFATLRTLGATRRQVMASVIVEALVIGALASLIGLLVGFGLAKGLNALFKSAGIDLPQAATVLASRTILVSLVVGLVVTLLASLRPALRATRVPPIAAVREGSTLPPSRLARFGLPTALGVLGLGIALLVYGVLASGISATLRLLSLGVGVLALFFGIALVAPRLVRPLASVLGWPGTQIGGAAGDLARANAMRNPGRTASTAAALMIGLALVTFVAVLAQGLRSSFESAVDDLFKGDYAITSSDTFTPLTIEAEKAATRAPGVEVVSGIRGGSGRAFDDTLNVTAVDSNLPRVISVEWKVGSDAVPRGLGNDGAFVDADFAKENDLSVGSAVPLLTPTGRRLDLRVKGIFEPPKGGSPFGKVTISTATFDRVYPQPANIMAFVNVRGGVSEAATSSLDASLKKFPDAKVRTAEQFKKDFEKPLNNLLNLLYVLLGLSIIVSLFGIVNTLVLTVFERTRELGMLRAVGMTRRQVRRMIRHESVVTSLIGAALGIVVGILLALLVTQALEDEGVVFAIPYASLPIFVVAAIFVGIVAAILPARRASRLNVLEALQYE